jgi:hypothetical protein
VEERKFLGGLTREEKMEWAPSLLEAVTPHINEARENARKAEEQRVRELEKWVKEDERRFAENERLNQKLREQETARHQQKLKESTGIDNSPRPGRGSGPEL